jgi:tetratricopeptide (TPR) repeat protein
VNEQQDASEPAGRAQSAAGRSRTLDGIADGLRSLRSAAGHPSYAEIARRIGRQRAARGVPASEQKPARATVYDCFRTDRRRLDIDLVVDIVRALGADDGEAARWAQACRVAQSQADAATVVTAYAELPAQIESFVGRDGPLAAILRAGADPQASPVFSIEGMPGSGKTQLAIRAARRLIEGGQVEGVLYADLRGFNPDHPPADPTSALDSFLRLLDVPGREIPGGLAKRQARLRERLGSRRHVIVLDDAADAVQVRPLLLKVPGTVTLVTSRTALSDAVNSVHIPLEVFSLDESVALLREVAGAELVDADIASATKLAEASGCLPLAVGLTATRIAARRGWNLADHVEPLLTRKRGLRLDDAVQATLELSYAALSPSARTTLRLLATQPCADLDEAAIAELTDTDVAVTAQHLDELVTHHVVSRPRPGRYALHSLVQIHALDRSYDEDRPTQREAALHRLCDHHVAMVWAAYRATYSVMGTRNREAPHGVTVPEMSEEAGRQWLGANIENILTLASQGAELGRPDLALHLSDGLAWWLNRFGRYGEARLVHRIALEAAVSRGNQVSEARANLDLGQILVRLTEWDTATVHLTRAAKTFENMVDPYGASSAVNALAIIDVHLGRLSDGIDQFHRSLELSRAAGSAHGEANALDNIAITHRRAGRLEEAVKYHAMALDKALEIGDKYMQASGLTNVSEVQLLLGRRDDALQSARRGLEIAQSLNNTPTIAYGNDNIGSILSADGDHEGAQRHYLEALRLSRDIGDVHLEASVLNNLGTNHRRTGEYAQARSRHSDAHAISTKSGDTFSQAHALDGLGAVHAAEGSTADARRCWTDALTIFEQLGSPEAAGVRDRLEGLPSE